MLDIRRKTEKEFDTSFTQDRELSWLKFDERVLEEAEDETVPLLERMKFVDIFTTNLDEFFMVRVGSLMDLRQVAPNKLDNKSAMTPGQELDAIFDETRRLYKKRETIYKKVCANIEKAGIVHLNPDEMDVETRLYFEQYFKEQFLPVISPQIIDLHHPFPHIENKELLVGALIKQGRHVTLGMVPLVPQMPMNKSLTTFSYEDNSMELGTYYNYTVTGYRECDGDVSPMSSLTETGFALPYGVVTGQITYDGRQGVPGVLVTATTDEEVPFPQKVVTDTTEQAKTITRNFRTLKPVGGNQIQGPAFTNTHGTAMFWVRVAANNRNAWTESEINFISVCKRMAR